MTSSPLAETAPAPLTRVTTTRFLSIMNAPSFTDFIGQDPEMQAAVGHIREALQGVLAHFDIDVAGVDHRYQKIKICEAVTEHIRRSSELRSHLADNAVIKVREEIGRRLSIIFILTQHPQWPALVAIAQDAALHQEGKIDKQALLRREGVTDIMAKINCILSQRNSKDDKAKIHALAVIADLLFEQVGQPVRFVNVSFHHRRDHIDGATQDPSEGTHDEPPKPETPPAPPATAPQEISDQKEKIAGLERAVAELRRSLDGALARIQRLETDLGQSPEPAQPAAPAPVQAQPSGAPAIGTVPPHPAPPPAPRAPAAAPVPPPRPPTASGRVEGYIPPVVTLRELRNCHGGRIVVDGISKAALDQFPRLRRAGIAEGTRLEFRVEKQPNTGDQARLTLASDPSLKIVVVNQMMVDALDPKKVG